MGCDMPKVLMLTALGALGLAGCVPVTKSPPQAKASLLTTETTRTEALLAERSECLRHCELNFDACMETANSPDARQECQDTRVLCRQGC